MREIEKGFYDGAPGFLVFFWFLGFPLSLLGLVLCAIGMNRSRRLVPGIGLAAIGLLYGLCAFMEFRP